MDDHTLFTELKKILADLYVELADAKRIAADAGLDLAQIPFDAKAINNWETIPNRGQVERPVAHFE